MFAIFCLKFHACFRLVYKLLKLFSPKTLPTLLKYILPPPKKQNKMPNSPLTKSNCPSSCPAIYVSSFHQNICYMLGRQ